MRSRGLRRAATLGLALALLFAWVVPAQAGPIILPIHLLPFQLLVSGVAGTVTDAGTAAPIQGVLVSAYNAADGSYIWSTITNSSGYYRLYLDYGKTYKVQLRDPAGRYGEQWYSASANFTDAFNRGIATSQTVLATDVALHQAMSLTAVARRAGHPFTRLSGQYVILQQKSVFGTVQTWSGSTGGSGSAHFGGLMPLNVTYKESAIDPTGMFYSDDATSAWLPYAGGANHVVYFDLTLAQTAKDVSVSVPKTKATHKKGKAFTVTGTLGHRVNSPKALKIYAVKGGTTKTFTAKIKAKSSSSTYSGSVKLGKGTWTLYAVFGGNGTWAPTDSVTGKVVYVK